MFVQICNLRIYLYNTGVWFVSGPSCLLDTRENRDREGALFSLFFSMSTPGTKRLFVGNVPFRIEPTELRALFEEVAPVADFFWPTDRETGRKKGFLFVDVDEADMGAVIEAMNGKDVMGRQLAVNEAQPREAR